MRALNDLRWDGSPGHYEVHYLTATEPVSGTGLWIRQTLLAPDDPAAAATCSAWFMATFADGPPIARKATWPVAEMQAVADPFRLRTGTTELTDTGMGGAIDDVRWDLRWVPSRGYRHVRPLLERARVTRTVMVLPHGDLAVSGTVALPGGREVVLDAVHAGQAHLWGSQHSERWAWAHCGDFRDADGAAQLGTFLDGASVHVRRLGRELGPSTPVVGCLLGEEFDATSPVAVLRAPSRFALTSWAFEATAGARRVRCAVDAPRPSLVGVTYTDPDGREAYCYNSEVASMRVSILDRTNGRWTLRQTLFSDGRAHFEYGQRSPVPGSALHLT